MRQSGFIALTSAIIISALLLAITLTIIFSAYFARFNVLDSESKERSIGLAEACADTAVLDVIENTIPGSFPTSEINVGTAYPNDKCIIYDIVTDSPAVGKTTIKTQASPNKAFTNLQIVIDSNDFTVQSWEELPNF